MTAGTVVRGVILEEVGGGGAEVELGVAESKNG